MFTSEMTSFFKSNIIKENENQENKNNLNKNSSSNGEVSQSSSCMQSSQVIIKIENFENSVDEKISKKNIPHTKPQQTKLNNKLLKEKKKSENSIKSISKMNISPKPFGEKDSDYSINIKSSKNPKLSYYNSNLKEIKKIILNSEDIRSIFTKNIIKIYYEEKKHYKYSGSKSPTNSRKKRGFFPNEKGDNFSKFKSNKEIADSEKKIYNKKASLFTNQCKKFENELNYSIEIHEEEVNIMNLIINILQKQVGTRIKDELFLVENYLKTFPNFMKILNSDNYSNDSDDLLKMITKYIKCEIVPKNTLLCRFGELGEKFYIIFKGNASILIPKEIHTHMNIIEYENRLTLLSKMKEYELLYKTIISNRHTYMNSDILTMKIKLELDNNLYKPEEIENREIINPIKYILRLEPIDNYSMNINNNKNNIQEKTKNNNNEIHKNNNENNNIIKKKQSVLTNENVNKNNNNEIHSNRNNHNNEVNVSKTDNNVRHSFEKNNIKSNIKDENSSQLKITKHITQPNLTNEIKYIKQQHKFESNKNMIHLMNINININENKNNSFNYSKSKKNSLEEEPKILKPVIKNSSNHVNTNKKPQKNSLKRNQKNSEIYFKKENITNLNSSKLYTNKKENKETETNENNPNNRESPRKPLTYLPSYNIENNIKEADLIKYKKQNIIIWSYFNVTNLIDGQTFGDVALSKESKKRTATIITVEDTICGTLDVNLYNRCIRDAQRKIRKTILHFLLSINFLRGINEDVFESKYLNMFKLNTLNRDDFLFKLGGESNCVYIIKQGEIAVSMNYTIMEINDILEKKNVDLDDSKSVEENMCKISENFKNFYKNKKLDIIIKVHTDKSTIGLNDYVINENGKKIFYAEAKCISENAEIYTVDDNLLKNLFINEKCVSKGEFIFKNMEKNTLLRIIDIKKNYILKRFDTFKERRKANADKNKYLKYKNKKLQKTEINISENKNFFSKNITKLSFNKKIDNKNENENEKNKEESENFNNNIDVHLTNEYLSYLNTDNNLNINNNLNNDNNNLNNDNNNLNNDNNNLNLNCIEKSDYNDNLNSVRSKFSDSTILACLERQDSQNLTDYIPPYQKRSTKNMKNSEIKRLKSNFGLVKNFDDNSPKNLLNSSNLNIVILNISKEKENKDLNIEKNNNENKPKSKSLTKKPNLSLPNIFDQNKKYSTNKKSKIQKIPLPKSKYKKKSIVSLVMNGMPVINANNEISYKSIDLRNTKSYNDIFKPSKEKKIFYKGCKGLLKMENNNNFCPTLNLLVYDEMLEKKTNFQRKAKSAMTKKEKKIVDKGNRFQINKKIKLDDNNFNAKKFKMNIKKIKKTI